MTRILTALLVFASVCAAQEPKKVAPPTGLWMGILKGGPTNFRFVFQIDADKDGKLTGKLTSVDELGLVIPYKSATFEGRTLTLDLPLVKAKYIGTLDEAGKKITGEWEQHGSKLPLVLEPTDKIPVVNRPQLPKPPFPYAAEDVKIPNATAKIDLAGTLTMPKGMGPFAAVVLVTGSGAQDRDETLFGHKPFFVLADHLTKAGFAVLRYDDRGTAKSGGKFAGATSADFATDAYAAVKYLQTRKEIDSKRVGICGHSEGGMVGPMVAAEHPGDIAFLVMLAGPGISGGAILKRQTLDSTKKAVITEKEVEMLGQLFDDLAPLIGSDLPADKLMEAITKKLDEAVKKLPDDERRKKIRENLTPMAVNFAEPWLRYFFNYDPVPVLKKLKCPVLAVNGAKDVQVRCKENLDAITAAFKASGNAKATIKELPDLNHLFQKCKTGEGVEYGQIEETFNPEALKTVSDWLTALPK